MFKILSINMGFEAFMYIYRTCITIEIFFIVESFKDVDNSPIKVDIIQHDIVNWNLLTLIIAILTLIAAVIIPFAQKKYEENKTIFNFKLYIKSQFGYIFNQATYDKYEYFQLSIKDDVAKMNLTLKEFARKINEDFKAHQNSVQPRIIFHFILNLQNFCYGLNSIRLTIAEVDIDKIKDNTLSSGEKLSSKELNSIYGLMMVLQSFQSISHFHDRFGDLKSIKRNYKGENWVGLKLEGDFLSKQNLLAEDMKDICNLEGSLIELLKVSVLLSEQLSKYYSVAKPTFDIAIQNAD